MGVVWVERESSNVHTAIKQDYTLMRLDVITVVVKSYTQTQTPTGLLGF